MARKFMIYDVVSCVGIGEATVDYVDDFFIKTDRGWFFIDYVVLIRPFDQLYKGQFESGNIQICDKPTQEDQLAFKNTSLALTKMMEK